MDTTFSPVLQEYYNRTRARLATEPAVRSELQQLGIASVAAEYDGVGDSGQIDQITYRDNALPPHSIEVSDDVGARVETLLYALLECRHSGWENNDGAFGSFKWNLEDGALEHEHNQRFTDHDTTVHEGFEVGKRDLP